jgi:hypothetical protein
LINGFNNQNEGNNQNQVLNQNEVKNQNQEIPIAAKDETRKMDINVSSLTDYNLLWMNNATILLSV